MAELVLDNLDLELVQQGWGPPKNANGKKALNRYLTTFLTARLYWSGQLQPETVVFQLTLSCCLLLLLLTSLSPSLAGGLDYTE